METNFMEIEVKGEAECEPESALAEHMISLENNDVIEDISDPLDFLKTECSADTNNAEEECSNAKDPAVMVSNDNLVRQCKCNICYEEFPSKEELREHSSAHKSINHIFMCSECSECFVTRTSLNTHKLTHLAKNTNSFRSHKQLAQCVICDKRFADGKALDKHISDKHNRDEGYECDICQILVASPAGLKKHKRIFHPLDAEQIDRHQLKEHADKRLECDICHAKLLSSSSLKSHKLLHETVECNICHKRFADSGELNKHTFDQHKNEPEKSAANISRRTDLHLAKCNRCHNRFTDTEGLSKHKRADKCVSKVYYKESSKCNKRFASSKKLYEHKINEDVDENDFNAVPKKSRKRMTPSVFKRYKRNVRNSERSFNCDSCLESFESNAALNTHKFTHIGGKITFQCNMCDNKFDCPDERNSHELVHENKKTTNSSDKSFECPICHTQFANRINLNYHMKTHHFLKNTLLTFDHRKRKRRKTDKSMNKTKTHYVCGICHKRFAYRLNLIHHRKTHHKTDGIDESSKLSIDAKFKSKLHECNICHKQFKHKNNLIVHKKSHYDPNYKIQPFKIEPKAAIFECKTCFKKLATAEKLKNHVMIIHMQGDPYRCNFCHKRFAHKRKLEIHLETRHEDIDTENSHQIVCNLCSEEFTSLSELTLHKQSQHSLECDICHKRFTTKYVLRDHIRIHTGEMPYECEECHRQFRTLMNLNGHMIVHTQEKRHECTICHEWFTRTSNLKYHLNKQHFSSNEFECDICHEQFSTEHNRDQHKKTQHSEDATFECEHCLKKFKNKYALKEHERIHTGEKPYECKYCAKRFRTGPNLNSHVGSVHKQDKNHVCCICHKRFSRGSNLNRHVKTHLAGAGTGIERRGENVE